MVVGMPVGMAAAGTGVADAVGGRGVSLAAGTGVALGAGVGLASSVAVTSSVGRDDGVKEGDGLAVSVGVGPGTMTGNASKLKSGLQSIYC